VRTAVWLYFFMFLAFFDLHAQYPVLSPFALSLGATPAFIGMIMGMYSITHLPGNILAGIGVDRFGSKHFIVFSLIIAGIVLILQSQVTNPWQLLIVRSISGFVLAFLSPACLTLLAKIARDRLHQGKLMSGNGLVHTLASVVSPAAGAVLVAKVGFTTSFTILGWILIITGTLSIFGIKEPKFLRTKSLQPAQNTTAFIPWLFYALPVALSCSQGILFFELPLIAASQQSIMTSGILFSIVSLGSLCTLSLLFLNRYSPFIRTAAGGTVLALTFFGMAVQWPFPLMGFLLLIGMSKGIIYPAMASFLVNITDASRYGRIFAILSISFSIGAFIGPVLAGQLRDHMSPYFISFMALMIALLLLPLRYNNSNVTAKNQFNHL
jgi:MFS family permease